MKTNELIPALALDDLLSMAASAIEDLLEHTDPNTSYYSGVWADVPGKLRAAMLQADTFRENENSSTESFRENSETSTNTLAIRPALFIDGDISSEDREKLIAAMRELSDKSPALAFQVGNSPVIPDGYVMVPKEPTEEMMLHNSGCQHHAWDDPDCAMRQTRRLIWSHMLTAALREVES